MSIRNKIIATILGLSLVLVMVPSGVALAALSSAQVSAIISLLQSFGADATTIANVQASLTGGTPNPVPGTGNYQGIPAGFTFVRNITVGTVSQDVVYLKAVLIGEGCGNGITNTTYYGPHTVANVQCFQNKYKTQISAFAGYTIASTGLVGTGTRAQLNALLAGTSVPPVIPPVIPPTVNPGGLSVGLSYDTPSSTSIAEDTNANFTKFALTASSAGNVNISKIYVTRAGLSANSIVENIKIVDAATGTYKGSIGSLNVDNRAMITFTPALVIPAGTTQTYFIRAGINGTTTNGFTVSLGIAANTDIVSNATGVTGAPVVGNAMSTIILTVGSLSVAEDGTTVDSTPDVGDTNVTLNQFKLTAGSTESVTVETITALKAGTAESSDVANLELYDVTHGVSLGTIASWDSEAKATFSNLGLTIGKGESLRLKIMADIIGGVASTPLTVNADIVDGSDTLIVAKGNTYGFYLTVAEGTYTGIGTAYQTINSGALNLSKSSTSPATGKISAGDSVVLGVFDFDAKGEEMRVTALRVEATLYGMTYDEVTSVRLFDEAGNIVAGPQDMTTIDATHCYAAFTDTFIVPVGVHRYTVKVKLADAVGTGDTILVNIDRTGATGADSGTMTVKGMTSGDTIYPTPLAGTAYQDMAGNTLTVAAGDLDLITLTIPLAGNVALGFSDYIWAVASLSAADSGEDAMVSTISVEDTNTATADADDIDNMELWADLTSANSSRGDVYETKISNTENPSGNAASDNDVTTDFTLSQSFTVTKGSFVKVALVADLNANAVGTATSDGYTFDFPSATVTGVTSGENIVETPTGAGQKMTIVAGGVLTLTKDSSSPVSDIVVSGATSALGVFRLAASNVENLDVDDVTFAVTGGAGVDTYYLYNGTTQVGTASGGTAPKFTLADGTITVPKGNYVRLTLKGKMIDLVSTVNDTAITAGLNANDAVNTTGLASGSEVDSDTTDAQANEMNLYQTKPTFAAVSTRAGYTLAGNLIPATAELVAIFDVTANANEDVTFEKSSSSITVNVSRTEATTDGSVDNWILKDQDGTTLSTVTLADAATEVVFTFEDAELTIPAGLTRSLFVYADTTEYSADGDTIQVWLDDAATDIDWSINNDGVAYYDGDKIFRNDIWAGSFVNPS